MSAKQEKRARSLMKNFQEQAEINDYLYDVGYEFFDEEEDHEDWFSTVCFIRMMIPEIPDDALMPPVLPFFMYDNGLIKKEEINEMLPANLPYNIKEEMKAEWFRG